LHSFNNRLLRLMGDGAARLVASGTSVRIAMRQRFDEGASGEFAYFIEDGVASVIADIDGKMAVELGIIGSEGMVGLSLVYGDRAPPYVTVMQVEGNALRVPADDLIRAMAEDEKTRLVLLRFANAFSIQVATTALANGRNKLEERLARWLLMVGDRAGTTFAITHEFISVMLGVRRSGVTVAVQVLEGRGLIRASRGSITILNRDGLRAAANGAYGFAEAHYARLLETTT